jgi:beta-fructofuranosidase
MQTLPRALSLGPDGLLRFDPADDLEALRSGHRRVVVPVLADRAVEVEGVAGAQLEVRFECVPAAAAETGILLRQGSTEVVISYDPAAKRLRCKGCAERTAPLSLANGEPLALRVFFDGSVVETFANRRVCCMNRTYPEKPAETKVFAFARGSASAVVAEAWRLEV